MPQTSVTNGHSHSYKEGDKRTGVTNGHSHPIVGKTATKGTTNHTHKIK